MPILGEIFKDFKESISNQIENDLIFSQNDLMNRNSISQDLSSQIDNIKESIILIHKDSSEFNKAYREEIREINNIKFELHLLEKPGKITKEKSSEIEKRGSFNEDYKLNNLPSENSNFRANTIQTIDSQASFLNKKNKKKEFNCSVFQRQQNMKISDFECYQLKSKLNSLKEDHLLFSNFIDFRLNPSKYQKLNIDMPKTVESIHTNSLYSYKINNFAEICASDRAFNKSCLTIDNGSQAGIVVNQDQIDYLEENKEDIQRILDQEVIVSWGEKNGLLLRSFEYLIMFMSLVMNRVLNVAVLTKKRILF